MNVLKTAITIATILSFATFTSTAQQGMGVGNNNPQEMLDVSGAIKLGTTVTTNTGTIRWNGTNFQGYNGSQWVNFDAGADTDWVTSGSDQYSGVTGNIGVGTNSPTSKLHLFTSNAGSNSGIRLTNAGANSFIYQSGGDLILRKQNQADQLVLDWTGNIGIGTNAPSAGLHIERDENDLIKAYYPTLSNGFQARIRLGKSDAAGENSVLAFKPSTGDATLSIHIEGDTYGSSLTVEQGGFVGVGIADPTEQLHVNGSVRMVDGNEAVGYIPVSDADGVMTWTDPTTVSTSNDGDWTLNGNDQYSAVSGNVGIGTSTPASALHVANTNADNSTVTFETGNLPFARALIINPSTHATSRRSAIKLDDWVILQDRTGTGLKDFAIYQSSVLEQRFNIDVNGNVGIGDETPEAKLDVEGSIQMVDGNEAVGFIPVSDANGTMTWTDPTTIATAPDADNDASNEIQTLAITGSDISLSNGGGTVTIPVGDEISDADNNTKVQVEESANEDIIRFDLAGTEKWIFESSRIVPANSGNSVFIGNLTGEDDDLSDNKNVFIGNRAGRQTSTGQLNVALGNNALERNVNGNYNVAIGDQALSDGLSGSDNIAIGRLAMEKNAGSINIAVGRQSLSRNTTGIRNVAIGYQAGLNNITGSSNVFIGERAGSGETGSDRLYIENTAGNSSNALIYGEFDNDILKVNGELIVNGSINIDNDYTLPTDDGSNGNVMLTDGAGVLSWVDPATITAANDGDWTVSGNDQYSTVSGNVGLGTSTPSSKLHVFSTTTGPSTGIKLTTAGSNSLIYQTGGDMILGKENQANQLVLDWAGNIGIGTNAPTVKLDVQGSIRMVDGNQTNGFIPVSDANGIMTWTDPTAIITANDGDWTIDGNDQYSTVSGNVGLGTSTPSSKLHVFSTTTGPSTGIKLTTAGSNSLIYQTGGDMILGKENQANQLVLDWTGNIGIGTNAPTVKLDVQGSIRMVDGNQTNGFIPVSDANGIMTWTDPTAITTANDGDWTIDGNDQYSSVSGKVGIGTDDPDYKLHVRAPITSSDGLKTALILEAHDDDNNFNLEEGAGVRIRLNVPGESNSVTGASIEAERVSGIDTHSHTNLVFRTSGNDATLDRRMTITHDGRVGIGSSASDPTQGQVVITGSVSYNGPSDAYIANGFTSVGTSNGVDDYSLYAYGSISCASIHMRSDERIKNIFSKTDNHEDLEILKKIEIVDYQFKDQILHGNDTVKKVIAQQVAQVYPLAVHRNGVSSIPDVMKMAQIKNGTVQLEGHSLNTNDRVELVFGTEKQMFDIVSVEENSFVVNSNQDGDVFVFGREVNDLHSVDYDALSMLNISATQELARQNEELKKRISDIESRFLLMSNSIEELKTALQTDYRASK